MLLSHSRQWESSIHVSLPQPSRRFKERVMNRLPQQEIFFKPWLSSFYTRELIENIEFRPCNRDRLTPSVHPESHMTRRIWTARGKKLPFMCRDFRDRMHIPNILHIRRLLDLFFVSRIQLLQLLFLLSILWFQLELFNRFCLHQGYYRSLVRLNSSLKTVQCSS